MADSETPLVPVFEMLVDRLSNLEAKIAAASTEQSWARSSFYRGPTGFKGCAAASGGINSSLAWGSSRSRRPS
jgi:hypothetical protein